MAPPALALRTSRWAEGAAGSLALAAAWTVISSGASGGSPYGVVGTIAASAATLVATSLLPRSSRWRVLATITGSAVILAVVFGGDILSPSPRGGPFGYANATGGFYLLATVAGLMLATSASTSWARRAGWAAAAPCAVIVVTSGSAANSVLLVLVAAALGVAPVLERRPGITRVAIVGMGALLAVVFAGSVVIGAGYGGGRSRNPLDERRQALWRDAITLIRENPVVGVGPGRFATESPVARSDADARWAHNGFLQVAAEIGLPGLLLIASAFAFTVAGLAATAQPDVMSILATAGVIAFGIGSSVDYLMHFPALPVTAAALAGTAMNSELYRREEANDVPNGS